MITRGQERYAFLVLTIGHETGKQWCELRVLKSGDLGRKLILQSRKLKPTTPSRLAVSGLEWFLSGTMTYALVWRTQDKRPPMHDNFSADQYRQQA